MECLAQAFSSCTMQNCQDLSASVEVAPRCLVMDLHRPETTSSVDVCRPFVRRLPSIINRYLDHRFQREVCSPNHSKATEMQPGLTSTRPHTPDKVGCLCLQYTTVNEGHDRQPTVCGGCALKTTNWAALLQTKPNPLRQKALRRYYPAHSAPLARKRK